jgi:hypothetical protein
MIDPDKERSVFRSWLILLALVGIVAFQGILTFGLVGDLGMPGWDYRPVEDVPGESAYTLMPPYHPLPYPQHVQGEAGNEQYPLRILGLEEAYDLQGDPQ